MSVSDQSDRDPSDEELLAGHVAGQAGRFDALVRRYAGELYRFLARFTGNAASAEDLVQDTFLQVYMSAGSFDPGRRFRPWLFAIAANKARDMMRWRSRRPEVPLEGSGRSSEEGQRFLDLLWPEQAEPDQPLEAEEQRQLVREVVEQMPEHLREVLVLAYYHHFAYREIAEVLQIPVGTVKSRLHAAVGHFARLWRERMEK